jgi:hypothetical protein
LIDA